MKKFVKATLVLALVGCSTLTTVSTPVFAAGNSITTTKTGYTSADDVNYQKAGQYVKNWGARGEDCTFLSTYAEDFYQGSYTYEVASEKSGGTSQSNAYQSDLYRALQSGMKSKHSHTTSYGETRDLYKYTDCLRNDSTQISSFYSGKTLSGTWDAGKTWNREHTWPNSKGLGGQDENDIMMLRPTWVQENSSRGNTAYGQSSGYFDPGVSTRGDCARIVLYVYTRWGNTSYMWGKSGVMENLDVLLQWMEEDPVDTWEMGRNDAVQSITGTRNVFVDYPEYAWLLFGRDIPDDMSTPSGIANDGDGSSSSSSSSESSSVGESSSESSSANSSVGESSSESSSANSSVGESSSESSSANSSVGESSSESSSNGGSASEESGSVESSSSGEGSSGAGGALDLSAILAGCNASVGGVASALAVAFLGAYALKKRKK